MGESGVGDSRGIASHSNSFFSRLLRPKLTPSSILTRLVQHGLNRNMTNLYSKKK